MRFREFRDKQCCRRERERLFKPRQMAWNQHIDHSYKHTNDPNIMSVIWGENHVHVLKQKSNILGKSSFSPSVCFQYRDRSRSCLKVKIIFQQLQMCLIYKLYLAYLTGVEINVKRDIVVLAAVSIRAICWPTATSNSGVNQQPADYRMDRWLACELTKNK